MPSSFGAIWGTRKAAGRGAARVCAQTTRLRRSCRFWPQQFSQAEMLRRFFGTSSRLGRPEILSRFPRACFSPKQGRCARWVEHRPGLGELRQLENETGGILAHRPALGENYLLERGWPAVFPQVNGLSFSAALLSRDLVRRNFSQAGMMCKNSGNSRLASVLFSQAGTLCRFSGTSSWLGRDGPVGGCDFSKAGTMCRLRVNIVSA